MYREDIENREFIKKGYKKGSEQVKMNKYQTSTKVYKNLTN